MGRRRRLLPILAAVTVAAGVSIPLAFADDTTPGTSPAADSEMIDTHAPVGPQAPLAPGVRYVALGDSYTSAPGVAPVDSTAPPACGRSAANYPHLVAKTLSAALSDVSCGGAQTMSLYEAQYPGVPAQLDALHADTTLVTLGIGGNDHDLFATAMGGCAATVASTVAGQTSPCKDKYNQQFSDDIASSGALIQQALKNIHAEAPQAQVVVVGYPDLLPTTPEGRLTCAAAGIPFTPDDIEFLDGVERELNSMLQTAATATSSTFLDTYTPSIGHDMCQVPGVRWIEPVIPLGAAPVHPNEAGQAAVASELAAVVTPRS